MFSILHISDLHRDLKDEISNDSLLNSLERDFAQFNKQSPSISKPSLCIVSGDLIYGVNSNHPNSDAELKRQYKDTENFLAELAHRHFGGEREKIVLLPGNHDVSYQDVVQSLQKVDTPENPVDKKKIVSEYFLQNSKYRWSWTDLCFYKIVDDEKYKKRFRYFSEMYRNFYNDKREFSLDPENQFDIFDFPDLNFSIATFNSCFNNDPLQRSGAFHPDTISKGCTKLRSPTRSGWLLGAAWHHNLKGGPNQNDYAEDEILQHLIDSGVSIAFHGHQHLSECFDEKYKLGSNPRKITTVSAGTLCADPHHLRYGVPRGYNIVEIDIENLTGKVHQRQMVNFQFNMPVWGPGHFIHNNASHHEFTLSGPEFTRPEHLNEQLQLESAEKLIGDNKPLDALDILNNLKGNSIARLFLVKALKDLDNDELLINTLWPPETNEEIIAIGGSILELKDSIFAKKFSTHESIITNTDASVREILSKIKRRLGN